MRPSQFSVFFFFNDTATTEIYTLSLHDALPIWALERVDAAIVVEESNLGAAYLVDTIAALIGDANRLHAMSAAAKSLDRKSTRLNSSHLGISYAVFCLKKKNIANNTHSACRHKV